MRLQTIFMPSRLPCMRQRMPTPAWVISVSGKLSARDKHPRSRKSFGRRLAPGMPRALRPGAALVTRITAGGNSFDGGDPALVVKRLHQSDAALASESRGPRLWVRGLWFAV